MLGIRIIKLTDKIRRNIYAMRIFEFFIDTDACKIRHIPSGNIAPKMVVHGFQPTDSNFIRTRLVNMNEFP